MAIVNIGILAHVDAGKTSLTERILFETGLIKALGRVDKGTTQTDTLELERSRGISIKSAVASFQLGDLTVNLIDTPGHSDFIAEVERSLHVLDAVILVISAVEGVQPQTRLLARAVQAAGLPLIIFVNKLDRLGARGETLLPDIVERLKLRVIPMVDATGLGERTVAVRPCDRADPAWRETAIDLLAELDERVIEEFDRSDGALSDAFLEEAIRAQVASGDLVPVYFGSAITGTGVAELLEGVKEWLPAARETVEAPVAATVFKIVRRPAGEKLVYLRLFAGGLAVRQRVTLQRRNSYGETIEIEERITGIDRFRPGVATAADRATAGDIAGIHGLREARIGDRIGAEEAFPRDFPTAFPLPALESVVRPVDSEQITQLRTALEQLAEQDPLISLRQRNDEGEISVRLYGEVQKEVLQETLAGDYGVAVSFGPSQTICVERPLGIGEAAEIIFEGENPFYATVGFRVEPGEPGSGLRYVRDQSQLGRLSVAFYRAIEETVHETFSQGLSGWEVTDCLVTLIQAGFNSVMSTAGDFRKLTPLVLMQALLAAGTQVCEPIEELELEIPEDTFGAVCGALINARATMRDTQRDGAVSRLIWEIPTAELAGIEQQLPGLTRGEGSWMTSFGGYIPVTTSETPTRKRVGTNPLNRALYLADVAQSQGSVARR